MECVEYEVENFVFLKKIATVQLTCYFPLDFTNPKALLTVLYHPSWDIMFKWSSNINILCFVTEDKTTVGSFNTNKYLIFIIITEIKAMNYNL